MSRYHHVSDYSDLENYEFEQLPKGDMFSLSINPYTGYVFVGIEKHQSSYQISYDVLREIVHACELLERGGSVNPLSDYVRFAEAGVLVDELVKAARKVMKGIREGSIKHGEKAAKQSRMDIEKAS